MEAAPPMAPAEAFGVSLVSPPFQELHAAAQRDLERFDTARRQHLQQELSRIRRETEQNMEDQRRTGNVRLLMGARSAVVAVEQAEKELAEQGDYTVPEEVRPEVRALVARWRDAKAESDARANEARERILESHRASFTRRIRDQNEGAEAAEDEWRLLFKQWVTRELPDPAVEPEPPADPAPGDEPAPEPEPEPEPEPDSPFIAETETAGTWTPRAIVTLELAGPDILRIPLQTLRTGGNGRQRNPLTGGFSTWSVEVVEPWPERETRYRLERLPDSLGVSLAEWPSERNRMTLVVRGAGAHAYPSEHAFSFLTSAGDEAPPGENTQWMDAAPGRIPIPVRTAPVGARVFVNDILQERSGSAAPTPLTLHLPGGAWSIRLELPGHVDRVLENVQPGTTRAIEWRFQGERDLPGVNLRVDPRQSWAPTGIRLQRGERVLILASGSWAIGSRGEAVGPEGYPNIPAFVHYYAGGGPPRQVDTVNYGALLVRIAGTGPASRMAPVGTEMRVSSRFEGELVFDVNEDPHANHRRDNRGTLQLRIIRLPTTPAP